LWRKHKWPAPELPLFSPPLPSLRTVQGLSFIPYTWTHLFLSVYQIDFEVVFSLNFAKPNLICDDKVAFFWLWVIPTALWKSANNCNPGGAEHAKKKTLPTSINTQF